MRDVSAISAPVIKSPEAKRADLRRMRAIATLLLVAMTAIFIVTTATHAVWPWVPYLRAFAEAGMVGACADWFAVVALFRHPLGIPIPHTAIVPNNRDRIAGALGRFMTNNFLSPKVAHQQFARLDVVSYVTRWINAPENTEQLAVQIGRALPQVLGSLRGPELSSFLGGAAYRGIEAIPAAPLASKLLAVLWSGGAAQGTIDRALDLAESSLTRHRPAINRIFTEHSSRWVPRWVDDRIAERVTMGLLSTIHEMRDPEHAWRVELRGVVEKLIRDLAVDPELFELGERIKHQILATPLLADQARTLWAQIEGGLQPGLRRYVETIAEACGVGLRTLGQWLNDHPERQQRLNRGIRLAMLRLLLPRRAEIGAYVTQVVRNWDSATLVNRLELEVGRDLQFIRINGTVVGGTVGLLIFALSKWIAPQ
jgi:uncharacterized membrane-anchored protein YjiN (DUF445 family)